MASHDETGLQQGQIKALAVEADHGFHTVKQLTQSLKLGRLLVIVAHEELVDGEPLPFEQAHPHQKGIGACTPGQAGGFGVHEGDALVVHSAQPLVAGQAGSDLRGLGQQITQGMVTMTVAGLVALAVQEKGSPVGIHGLARQQCLNGLPLSSGFRP